MPSFTSFSFRHFCTMPMNSLREIRFSAQPRLHRSGIKPVHILCVSGLQVLIAVSIFPTLVLIPATAYFWFMLPASRSFWSFSQAPALPPTGTAASPALPRPSWLAPHGPSPAPALRPWSTVGLAFVVTAHVHILIQTFHSPPNQPLCVARICIPLLFLDLDIY